MRPSPLFAVLRFELDMEDTQNYCLVCRAAPAIKRSHLIPRAMAREVQAGKAHAVAYTSDKFTYTQSGLQEPDILCAGCDNKLGALEDIAVRAFRKIRKEAKTASFGEYVLNGTTGDNILRFICGVLWKYSVATPAKGRIELGHYQDVVRDVAFSVMDVPETIDALLFRLKLGSDDDGVFTYRAPKQDEQEGVTGYRLLVGGMFIFVKTDEKTPKFGALERGSMRGKPDLPYTVLPAQNFEEYHIPANLVHSDGPLSKLIDKLNGR
jgi:hypothetical protein